MTSPAGLLDFFVLEASDYAERLDGAITQGGIRGPDPAELARYGRALRGTATMSRFPAVADLAGAIERVGRALHEGRIEWSPALAGAITSGVDEVKTLVRAARNWGPEHDARAQARAAELARYAPTQAASSPTIAGNAAAYLGGEVAAIATGLMAYLTTGGNEGALSLVVRRARSVQGVATVKDAPPVGDVVGAVEQTAAMLESRPPGERGATDAERELFAAAATVLQRAATDLRAGRAPAIPQAEAERFESARSAAQATADTQRVVPISQFLVEDGGEALVRAAPNPPMTARARFRAEMVSQAEHLRQLVAEARAAVEPIARARVGHELERALRGLERTSTSFGEGAAAAYFARMADKARALDPGTLGEIDAASATLAGARAAQPRPSAHAPALSPRPAQPAPPPAAPPGAPAPQAGPQGAQAAPGGPPAAAATMPQLNLPSTAAPPAGAGAPQPPATAPGTQPRAVPGTSPRSGTPTGRSRTPSGRELQSLLQEGIAGLGQLQSAPFEAPPARAASATPAAGSTAAQYSGRAALQRARDIRDTLRRRGTTSDPLLVELFALLDRITPD